MTTTETGRRGPERFASASVEAPRGSLGGALGAALALMVLLVGVPVALWLYTGPPPLPSGWPTRTDLTQPVGIDVILAVLRGVVWLAWLQFLVCTVVEVASFVRGGGLPHAVPASGPSQAVARALVGTLLVGVSLVGSSGGATAAPQSADPTVGASAAATAPGPTRAVDADDPAVAGDQRAEGTDPRALSVPGVPADMTDAIGHKVAIVQPPKAHYHDNLWDIAERHLGEGRRWREIFELNKHRAQPDGQELVLGRLIQPGWVLIMPPDATGLQRVTEVPVRGRHRAPDQSADQVNGPSARVSGGDQALPADDRLARDLLAGGLLGGALLAGLLAERRRRGVSGAGPEDPDTEVSLRAGADPGRADWLDRALRSLGSACADHRLALPPVYAAAVSDTRISLSLAGQHHDAPGAWTVRGDGRTWVIDAGVDVDSGDGPAPYPGLVCVGRDDEGSDILLDLESADGIVSVEGSPQIAREVVSAMAAQLATAPWADPQRVIGHDLTQALAEIGTSGVDVVAGWEDALAAVEGSGARLPADQVLIGRLDREQREAPQYLMLGSAPDGSAGERLAALTQEGTRGLGIVVAGRVAASRWRATVDDAGRLALPLLDVEVEAARLSEGTTEQLADLFHQARAPRTEVDGHRPPVPPTPAEAGDDATWSSASVRVGVLGSVEIRSQGRIDEARLHLATELVTFVALHTEPVHPSVVGASLWPRGVTADVRDATIARVRDWLGLDADGNHLLRETVDGRLHLAPDVGVDWHAFCVLARRSREAGAREESELLRRALQLVRGPFLEGTPARRYAWIVRTGLEQRSADTVVDVAHRLAELSLDDPSGGAAAARAGLRLVPLSQVLWRDLLEAESRGGDPDAAHAVADEMTGTLRSLDAHPDAETTALVEELLPGRNKETG